MIYYIIYLEFENIWLGNFLYYFNGWIYYCINLYDLVEICGWKL